jgi:hypothetical protein
MEKFPTDASFVASEDDDMVEQQQKIKNKQWAQK